MLYLLDHHRSSVAHNRAITVSQIIANEKQNWHNDIKYKTA
jgi:MULE transposase domain